MFLFRQAFHVCYNLQYRLQFRLYLSVLLALRVRTQQSQMNWNISWNHFSIKHTRLVSNFLRSARQNGFFYSCVSSRFSIERKCRRFSPSSASRLLSFFRLLYLRLYLLYFSKLKFLRSLPPRARIQVLSELCFFLRFFQASPPCVVSLRNFGPR